MKTIAYIFISFAFILSVGNAKAQATQEKLNLSDLSLEEKIAQMIIVRGDSYNPRFIGSGIGGFFIDRQKTKGDYKRLVGKYQANSKIRPFFATDMEGYWNPFPFYKSKTFAEIRTKEEAYSLGIEHAKLLKELGFNLDFSPVVESKNNVWPGRTFTGSNEEIKGKISSYINGLESEGIMATAKHYPGGSMLKDPHWFKVSAEISKEDLELFTAAINADTSAVMVGHPVVHGAINSIGKQSTISAEVISNLREEFNGLVITDATGMSGLRSSYLFNTKKQYIDLVKAGNDIILDTGLFSYLQFFSTDYNRVDKGIKAIAEAVEKGEISEERIDESVKKILEEKGYAVAY